MGYRYRGKGRKTWMIRYWIDGKRIDESSGTTDAAEADALMRRKETAGDQGLPAHIIRASRTYTFEMACDDIRKEYRRKGNRPNSCRALDQRLQQLTRTFAGRTLMTITTRAVTQYVDARLDAGAAHATINGELAALSLMFAIAMKADILHAKPHIAKLPTDDAVRQGFFEDDQFLAVCRHLPEWLRGPVTFAFYCGWRFQSEIAPLEWRQVDLDARIVRLDKSQTKNRDGRIFPYAPLPDVVAVFADADRRRQALHRAGRICSFVFHDNGTALIYDCGVLTNDVKEAWTAATIAAGVPGRLLHDFRRTAVRTLTRKGVPEKIAMELTGHNTRDVFDRYNIVNEADLSAAVAKLAQPQLAIKGKRQ